MTNKNLLIFAALAVVGYILYRQWKSAKDKNDSGGSAGTETGSNTGIIGSKAPAAANGQVDGGNVDINLTLYKGINAKASVRQLQAEMNQFLPVAYAKLETSTGVFGPKTLSALKSFWGREQVTIAQIRAMGKPPAATIYENSGGRNTSWINNFFNPFG